MELGQRDIKIKQTNEISIFFLGDIHSGNANHATSEFNQAIKIIKDTPNSYVFGMGDYADLIGHRDPRFNPSEISPEYTVKDLKNLPVKQMDWFYKKIEPIADKFLGLLYGNHEESFMRHNTFDPIDYLANRMNVPVLGYTALFRLGIIHETDRNRPNYNYIFDLNHGAGGGGYREGYPINKCHDLFRWTSGDVRVMGHIHALVEDDKKFLEYRQGNNLTYRTVWFGVSGCFLHKVCEGTRGYFENKPGPHSGIGMLRFRIKVGNKKHSSRTSLEKIVL